MSNIYISRSHRRGTFSDDLGLSIICTYVFVDYLSLSLCMYTWFYHHWCKIEAAMSLDGILGRVPSACLSANIRIHIGYMFDFRNSVAIGASA